MWSLYVIAICARSFIQFGRSLDQRKRAADVRFNPGFAVAFENSTGYPPDNITRMFEFHDPHAETDHTGLHRQVLAYFQQDTNLVVNFRHREYVKIRDLLTPTQGKGNTKGGVTELCDVSICNGGRHRSVAWALVKKWIIESLGHETRTWRLNQFAFYNLTCCTRGKPCAECLMDKNDIAEWFINDFNSYFQHS